MRNSNTNSVTIEVRRRVKTAVQPTERVLRVAGMFGLGVDEERSVWIVPPTTLELCGGQVVFVTGASGGGKSTLLRLIDERMREEAGAHVIRFDRLVALDDVPLVDALAALCPAGVGDELKAVMRVLSLAGLNDAFVMLRRPSELSDGQRYRLRLAQVMLSVDSLGDGLAVVLADEFGATLDRVTAAVVARNVRKWTRGRNDVCFVAATTHDDLLEPLEPDVLVHQELGEGIEVLTRARDTDP